ncbi:MAG TPA: transposase DNA-binding-containing protein, partial [Polyangiaceae bacterium]|nr:transposase DNA-binding-containing protein [Polyangiaceae bacterium]
MAWAQQTFGRVAFPDRRNVALAVRVAAGLVERPFAQVSKAFPDEAMRQAVYDLLAHPRCHAAALLEAAAEATADAAGAYGLVLVALDGVSLTLRDPNDLRGTGAVGRYSKGARGLQALDAVALTPGGAVLGLAGLVCWARPHEPDGRPARQRPVDERELGAWLDLRARVREAFARRAPGTRRVLVHDSGADAWPVLLDVLAHDGDPNEVSVIRAAQDRCAHAPDRPDAPAHLGALLDRVPQRQRRWVELPAGHGQPARRARLELRTRPVTLTLTLTPSGGRREVTLRAIRVRELGRVAPGSAPGLTRAGRPDARRRPAEPRFDCLSLLAGLPAKRVGRGAALEKGRAAARRSPSRPAGRKRASVIGFHRRQLVAVGVAKVKAAAAREGEDRQGDRAAGRFDRGERLLEIGDFDDGQRGGGLLRRVGLEADVGVARRRRGVGRA